MIELRAVLRGKIRNRPDCKFGSKMQDVEDPELQEALALSMSPLDAGQGHSPVNPTEFEDQSATEFI